MKSLEQISKIEAVVLYVLQHLGCKTDYIKLSKLLYFAQRQALVTYGRTIFDDSFKARTFGPVPALTYKVLKLVESGDDFQENSDLKEFASSIKIGNKMVTATREADQSYLSKIEKDILDEVIHKYGAYDSMKLSEMTHDEIYNEVMKRIEDDPQKDIFTLIDIARSGGASEAMLKYIREKQLVKTALS
uniref:Panacea domain-containing protein n=1 Tax=Prevotella sp. GTC17262 TaxID=3236797 RepID=A0AB33JP72_9BACT